MILCPPNCLNRALHCHNTCQRYQRANIKRKLELMRDARHSDEKSFRYAVSRPIQKRAERERKR